MRGSGWGVLSFGRLGKGFQSDRHRRHRVRLKSRPLELQVLEDRRVLAVAVDWYPATGQLRITGDHEDDRIAIASRPDSDALHEYLTLNDSESILTGQGLVQIRADEVTSIAVFAGGGNDAIDLSGVNGASFSALIQVNLFGDAGDDVVTGSELSDTLVGGDGHDVLDGGDGDDILDGGAGDDFLRGEIGNDTYRFSGSSSLGFDRIVGADHGIDALDFSGITVGGVSVDLQRAISTTMEVLPQIPGWLQLDLREHQHIENVIGTNFNDQIAGNWLNNEIKGLDGNDVLQGAGGNDRLIGGAGQDQLYGYVRLPGPGPNSAANNHTPSSATGLDENHEVNDVSTLRAIYGQDGADYLDGGLGNDYLHGGDEADTLIGAAGNDQLWGDAGDDLLVGGVGNDQLHGGTGADTLRGDEGNDLLEPGEGDDILVFAGHVPLGHDILVGLDAGIDTLNFSDFQSGHALTLDLSRPNEPIRIGSATAPYLTLDLSAHPQVENVIGTPYHDLIIGNHLDNLLIGGFGNDHLVGGGGDDWLEGGPGIDSLAGGGGDDTYVFAGRESLGRDFIYRDLQYRDQGRDSLDFEGWDIGVGITVDLLLARNTPLDVAGNGELILDLIRAAGIVRVIGTEYDDQLFGDEFGNEFFGRKGNDTLEGRGGSDRMHGEDGDDILRGGETGDLLYGGPGNDILFGEDGVDWLFGEQGDDLLYGDGEHPDPSQDYLSGGPGNDRLHGGIGNDLVWGNEGDDVIYGEGGDDQLWGDSGNDLLLGGDDNDRLHGGVDDDVLDGGSGFDHLDGQWGYNNYLGDLLSTNLSALTALQITDVSVLERWIRRDDANAFNGHQFVIEPPGDGEDGGWIEWSVTGLTGTNYQIYATWSPTPDAASNALFSTYDGAGALLDAQLADQRVDPTGPVQVGVSWQLVGEIDLVDSDSLLITLSNAGADGVVIANAIRIVDMTYYPPVANDDEFAESSEESEVELDVLGNDDVSNPQAATGIILDVQPIGEPNGQFTIAPNGQSIFYTSSSGTATSVQFEYTIEDGTSEQSTATGELKLMEALMQLRVEAVDLNGGPISSVQQGDTFRIDVFVQDLRENLATGVAAALMNLALPSSQVEFLGEYNYGPVFSVGRHVSTVEDSGVVWIRNIAAIGGEEVGGQEERMFSAILSARSSFVIEDLAAQIVLPEFQPSHYFALVGDKKPLAVTSVALKSLGQPLVNESSAPPDGDPQNQSDWQNLATPLDVDGNGLVTFADLTPITLELGQPTLAYYVAAGSWMLGSRNGAEPYLDVNGDGFLTIADWQVIANYWAHIPNTIGAAIGDFDGDGHSEILAPFDGSTWQLHDARNHVENRTFPTPSRWDLIGDFNGDGRDDLAEFVSVPGAEGAGTWYVSLVTETIISRYQWGTYEFDRTKSIRVGDFDGDGNDDLLQPTNARQWRVGLSRNRAFQTEIWGDPWPVGDTWSTIFVGDFDADGRDDILAQSAAGKWRISLSDSTGFYTPGAGGILNTLQWGDTYIGDFDGDGADELVRWRPSSSGYPVQWERVRYDFQASTPQLVFEQLGNQDSSTDPRVQLYVGDVNRDGDDDIFYKWSGQWYVASVLSGTSPMMQVSHITTPWFDQWKAEFYGLVAYQSEAPFDLLSETFSDIYNNVRLEFYPGYMKGPNATENTRRGNPWDQAVLLREKLAALGFDANIVSGRVRAPIEDVMAWLGVRDPGQALILLTSAFDTVATPNPIITAAQQAEFPHTWVRVNMGPHGPIDLDPSWKFRNFQPGVSGVMTSKPFDVVDYFSHPQNLSLDSPGAFELETHNFADDLYSWSALGTDIHYVVHLASSIPYGTGSIVLARPIGTDWVAINPPAGPFGIDPKSATILAELNPNGKTINTFQRAPGLFSSDLYGPNISGIRTGYDAPTGQGYFGVSSLAGMFIQVTGAWFQRRRLEVEQQLARFDTPYEYYENAIASYLSQGSSPKSLSEIPYDGPIIQRAADVFPRWDPAVVQVGNSEVIPNTSLMGDTHTHRLKLTLSAVKLGQQDLSQIWEHTVKVAEVANSIVEIRNHNFESGSSPIPHLFIDGVQEQAGQSVRADRNLQLRVERLDPGDNIVDVTHDFSRRPDQPLVLAIEASQHSQQSLQQIRNAVNSRMLALTEPGASVTAGVFSSVLALAGAEYWYEFRDSTDAIFALAHEISHRSSVGLGLVASDPRWEVRPDLPIYAVPKGLYVDMPGAVAGTTRIDPPKQEVTPPLGNFTGTAGKISDALTIMGLNSSALEHSIVERITNSHAVSR